MEDVTHRLNRVFLKSIYQKRRAILVLLAYILLTVVMTWPVAARLGTHLAGGRDDLRHHQWNFWWVKKSVIEGHNPFYTHLLYHPHGVSLVYNSMAWLSIAAWLPLQAIVGNNAAYNLIFITVFALNGFTMYLLVRELTGALPAAFIGGLVYGFWPYTMSHYDHPSMMTVFWVPLALLYLRRTLERRQKRDALLAALFLALTGLTRWHLLVMGGVAIGLYLLCSWLGERAYRTRRTLGPLVLAGLVAGALMAPMAIVQLAQTPPKDIFVDEQTLGQTDLLAYILPSRYHPLWGDAVSPLYKNLIVNRIYVPFLGYATITLALYGAVKNWRQSRPWVLAVAAYIALALGPQLRVNGQLYPQVPMPYRLVGNLFFIRMLRRPDRFNVFLGLPMGMLVSLGIEALLRQRPLDRKSALLVGVIGGLILGEYCPVPFSTWLPTAPTWYSRLAQEPGHFAVLDLPMHPRVFDKWYLFYQITHGKPLVEGHVSRPPREASTFIDGIPFFGELRQRNAMDPTLMDVSHQLQPLAEADIRYIILHKNFGSEYIAAWQDWLTFEPCHEDMDLVVYRTDPHLERDFVLAYDVTDEIGLIRATFTPTKILQASRVQVQVDARWGSSAAPGRDYDVCLNLVNIADEVAQSGCEPLSPTWPTSQWEADEVVRGAYTLQTSPYLEPGTYTLTLTLVDSSTRAVVGHPTTLGSLQIETLRPAHPLHVRWGDVILLRGYELQDSVESLELTLYWQAQRKMDVSYKVFVHLTDPTTGITVVQDDAVPRHWAYPTILWERDEVVEDTISLPLDGVSPGQYHLVVGLYDEGTGKRLPAYSADGEQYPDDAVPLTTVQH
jgi:hypothetical protein